jgi:dienelactone hydrolase
MVITSSVEYSVAGRVFPGVLSNPSPLARRPGVLIFHGGAGLGEHERQRARMLAELGYLAFAPDLFGERFESRAHGVAVINGLVEQPNILRERLNGALGWLRAQSSVDPQRTAAIGFCFGGLAALELARSGASVAAVVSFHGGLSSRAPAREGEVSCKMLVCAGSADPFVTREHRASFEDEMTNAKADWQMIVHGGALHGFMEPTLGGVPRPGCAYHQGAERRSWSAMRELFEETIDTPERSAGPLASDQA